MNSAIGGLRTRASGMRWLAALLFTPMSVAIAGQGPLPAEFAVRWDPTTGGPATARDALKALGWREKDKDVYDVRYFVARRPEPAPEGFKTILRERVKQGKKKPELTYKIRGDKPLPAGLAWECPLPTSHPPKVEVDVSFIPVKDPKTRSASIEPKRVYSASCEQDEDAGQKTFPAKLEASASPCRSKMTRLRSGEYKVEQWRLGSGATLIEVSVNGVDAPEQLAAFRSQVVAPLLKLGAKPVDRSKTEAGSDCKSGK